MLERAVRTLLPDDDPQFPPPFPLLPTTWLVVPGRLDLAAALATLPYEGVEPILVVVLVEEEEQAC